MRICVIFNPSARGEKAEALRARLDGLFPNCLWQRTDHAGHARFLAAEAVNKGFQTVIAAGGDGTVNEVLNGLCDVPNRPQNLSFGVLPLGTINVFARELGFPKDLTGAINILRAGRTKIIDLGRADYTDGGQPQRRYFIQLAGAGLDSRAIELVDWNLKKKVGALAYIVAGLKALRETQPVISVKGEHSASGKLVLVGNGRFYGGSFTAFPGASLQDGLLDVCILPKVTWRRVVGAGLGLVTNRLQEMSGTEHFKTRSVTLTSPSHVIFQLDGENIGPLPVTFTVEPDALQVIVP